MKISGIYKIQSKIKPEKIYIGSAVNITNRWRQHIHYLKNNKHPNKKLQNHFNKYGESDLQFSVLLGCEKQDLLKTEQYFIDSYKPWFNICPIAGSNLGKKGQIAWNKGLFGKDNPQAGKKRTTYAERGQMTGKGIFVSEKLIGNKYRLGKEPWNKGKKGVYSEETLKIMSLAKLNTIVSEETKEKHRKHKHSADTIQKIKNTAKNNKLPDDWSERCKNVWAKRKLKKYV